MGDEPVGAIQMYCYNQSEQQTRSRYQSNESKSGFVLNSRRVCRRDDGIETSNSFSVGAKDDSNTAAIIVVSITTGRVNLVKQSRNS